MIYYITSVTVSRKKLDTVAKCLAFQLGSGSARIIRLNPVPHNLETHQGLRLLAEHRKGGHVICSTLAEIPLLRLLKEVREGNLVPEDLKVIVMTADGKKETPRVDAAGEFVDRWSEGFFAARAQELF